MAGRAAWRSRRRCAGRPRDDLVLTLTHDRADLDPTIWYGTPLRDGKLVRDTGKKNYNVADSSPRLSFTLSGAGPEKELPCVARSGGRRA